MKQQKSPWLNELTRDGGARLVRRIAHYLGDPQQAEDLAQEVFLRLLRVDDDAVVRSPRAFALRVAANVAHEWRALARNRYPHSSDSAELLADGGDPLDEVLRAERVKRLEAALDSLSPNCRAVLLLHRRDRLSREQIATATGISVGMVKKHLAKALAVCRQYQSDLGQA